MEKNAKNIKVYQNGVLLDKTTLKRAKRLTEKRQEAIWLSEDSILLTGGRKHREQIKEQLLKEMGRVCYICGQKIPLDESPTLDHIVPKKLHGSDEKENCAICCFVCNQEKGSMTISQFLQEALRHPSSFSRLTLERIRYLDDLYNKHKKEV